MGTQAWLVKTLAGYMQATSWTVINMSWKSLGLLWKDGGLSFSSYDSS